MHPSFARLIQAASVAVTMLLTAPASVQGQSPGRYVPSFPPPYASGEGSASVFPLHPYPGLSDTHAFVGGEAWATYLFNRGLAARTAEVGGAATRIYPIVKDDPYSDIRCTVEFDFDEKAGLPQLRFLHFHRDRATQLFWVQSSYLTSASPKIFENQRMLFLNRREDPAATYGYSNNAPAGFATSLPCAAPTHPLPNHPLDDGGGGGPA